MRNHRHAMSTPALPIRTPTPPFSHAQAHTGRSVPAAPFKHVELSLLSVEAAALITGADDPVAVAAAALTAAVAAAAFVAVPVHLGAVLAATFHDLLNYYLLLFSALGGVVRAVASISIFYVGRGGEDCAAGAVAAGDLKRVYVCVRRPLAG